MKWMPASSDPSGLLRLVLHVHLRKGDAHVFRRAVAAAAAVGHAGDDDVVHLDDEELLLSLARLANRDRPVLQMDAGRAGLHEHGRGLVDLVRERQIVEGRLALATAAAERHGPGVGNAPRERQHFDLILVLVVGRFPLDVPKLRKSV